MDYSLAKQLKDAGFPGINLGDDKFYPNHTPTLSELIEACGDRFGQLQRNDIGEFVAVSRGYEYPDLPAHATISKTPEVAVALLWLELNKK